MTIQPLNLEEIARRNNLSIAEVQKIIHSIRMNLLPETKQFTIYENGQRERITITRNGVGYLKTPQGPFWQFNFAVTDQWLKYSVLVMADLDEDLTPQFKDPTQLVLRIDSGCETGQKFGDLTCDCNEQLLLAMFKISKIGEGIIINIPSQDGRGMGLPFKLATLRLQEDLNLDTVESATLLADGGPIDERTYGGAIAVLRFLGVEPNTEICLATNNPRKVTVFGENGYTVSDTLEIVIPPTEHTLIHLTAKQLHLGHYNLVHRSE